MQVPTYRNEDNGLLGTGHYLSPGVGGRQKGRGGGHEKIGN